MSYVAGAFDSVRAIRKCREAWRLKGGRIQANIRKAMVKKFSNCVTEDFMGPLTGVCEDKLYERNGRTIRVLELELTDDKGVVKCSLFGHFIDMMKGFMLTNGDELSVVVIQFAKVKWYMGKVSLYTVSNPPGCSGTQRFQKFETLRIVLLAMVFTSMDPLE
ncbi:Nucleic acid-binding, OB-fold [Sesbania bispinosa]|nr:Nucleic acid-binding, OB-fold [Sesbania bispinosa]